MRIYFVFLVLIATNSNAQSIKGVIKDSLTQKPIAYSSIVLLNSKGTYSDEKGNFEIDIKNNIYDTLKVSSVGFHSKFIPLNTFKDQEVIDLTILLSTRTQQLEEVLLFNKQIKYTNKQRLGEKRNGDLRHSYSIGSEISTYINNPKHIKGKVKRVAIDLRKYPSATYIATFNVKFYEYDKENNQPGKELYNKSIFVKPKNKSYTLWIDVEDFKIDFPENGLCVGIEYVNTIGKVEKFASFGPWIRFTYTEENKFNTWSNYMNKEWNNASVVHRESKKFKTVLSNVMLGLEVLYPSN